MAPCKYEYTMQLLAAMTAELIAKKRKKSKINAFHRFMKSKTAEMLFDDSLDFWMNGPDYIADQFFEEMSKERKSTASI